LDTPDNRKFVDGINAEYKHDPGFYTAGTYEALLIIEAALTKTGSKVEDAPGFLQALHEVRLDHGPIGPVRLDNFGTPVLDIHIRKVERHGGRLVNAILKTYPQVSQFWTYDPEVFVQQPAFSRDFPPAKFLE
jgi:branched-chain amino acid transport system substrate-binding protein